MFLPDRMDGESSRVTWGAVRWSRMSRSARGAPPIWWERLLLLSNAEGSR